MEIRELPVEELPRLMEIDRSEYIARLCTWRDGELVWRETEIDAPTYPAEYWTRVVEMCRADLETGGAFLAAFDGETLAGVAVVRYSLQEGMAQLAALFTSRAYRRQGVARALTLACFERARAAGAQRIYVSATPSESAVGFYTSLGFAPTDEPDPRLLALEPEDIHMIAEL